MAKEQSRKLPARRSQVVRLDSLGGNQRRARFAVNALVASRRLDIEQLVGLMVDLERRVVQVEVVLQHPLEPATRGVAVAVLADEYVR